MYISSLGMYLIDSSSLFCRSLIFHKDGLMVPSYIYIRWIQKVYNIYALIGVASWAGGDNVTDAGSLADRVDGDV